MFFEGSLQEGIKHALQNSKLVLCFVTNNQEESNRWEREWLVEAEIKSLIETRVVALRLETGSEGYGHLTAIFPVPQTPTIVLISQGCLVEYLAGGTTREEFRRRFIGAFGVSEHPPETTSSRETDNNDRTRQQTENQQAEHIDEAPPTTQLPPAPENGQPEPTEASSSRTPESSPSANAAQIMLSERAAKLDEQKKQQDEKAQRERQEQAKVRNEAAARDPYRSKHLESIRKQAQQAHDDRQRVLQAIENDKAARRARQTERDAAKRLARPPDASAEALPHPSATAPAGSHCSLQVRLFDGSTLRTRLPSDGTLRREVRTWVDETRADGHQPYTFKVLQTPLPSKAIDDADEDRALEELGLCPSATLVLAPVKKHAAAYGRATGATATNAAEAAPPAPGPADRLILFILSVIRWPFLVLVNLFSAGGGRVQGDGGLRPWHHRQQQAIHAPARAKKRDEHAQDQQLYNGNSVNFEPRIHDDDEEHT